MSREIEDLPARLAELTDPSRPMPQSLLPAIAAGAAAHRRRRVALGAAALVAIGAVAVGAAPAVLRSSAPDVPAVQPTIGLLGWPARGDQPIDLNRTRMLWDHAANGPHAQVRTLFGGRAGDGILVIVEGIVAGDARIGVFTGRPAGPGRSDVVLHLVADVPGGRYRALLVRTAPGRADLVTLVAVAAPSAPRLTVAGAAGAPILTVSGADPVATATVRAGVANGATGLTTLPNAVPGATVLAL